MIRQGSRYFSWLLLGLSMISYSQAQAQAQSHIGAVSAATGESGVAAVEASETPFGNPAALAHMRGYYLTAGFGATKQNHMGTNQDMSVSVTDSMKDTVVPTSFSYAQQNYRPEGFEDDMLSRSFKLSFGNSVTSQVAFGLGINYQDDGWLQDRYRQTNIETGFLWTPNANVGAAILFDNMIPAPDSIPEQFKLKQKTSIGTSLNYRKVVRVKADLISAAGNSFAKPTLAAGMESYLNRWLIFRWGLQRNNEVEANLYTAGLGFVGPKFALHYAYENSPQNESLTRHSVDLALPIW